MKKAEVKELPENIIERLNRNWMFNSFGCVNVSTLTGDCDLTEAELKESIQERFGKEMVNGKVEFI